jgi:hypothetical protein
MSKAHDTVRERGRQAALAGQPRRPPYADKRAGVHGNIVTGSRGYIRAWLDGYDSVDALAGLTLETKKGKS